MEQKKTAARGDCSGGGALVRVEPNGIECSCGACGRYFPVASTTTRDGKAGRVLPAHKRRAADELAIPVVDVPAGLVLGGAS